MDQQYILIIMEKVDNLKNGNIYLMASNRRVSGSQLVMIIHLDGVDSILYHLWWRWFFIFGLLNYNINSFIIKAIVELTFG